MPATILSRAMPATRPAQPTVYVIQDNVNHAYWPAERFGKLRHCLPMRGDLESERVAPRLREALRDFDAATDYLLISGAPFTCGLAFAIVHERFDRIKVLRWSVVNQDYYATTVDLCVTLDADANDSQFEGAQPRASGHR